jgi:hypothetical protein
MKTIPTDPKQPIDNILYELKERAKELSCLYRIQELLNQPGITVEEICLGMINALPPGWQYPNVCTAEIIYQGKIYHTKGFKKSQWFLSSDIMVQDEAVGRITVYYSEERPEAYEGPFLYEERKLINTVSAQFGFHLLHQQLKEVFQKESTQKQKHKNEWVVILDMLKRTNPDLLLRLSRRMTNYLGWHGVKEAGELLDRFNPFAQNQMDLDGNQPFVQQSTRDMHAVSNGIFSLASQHLPQEEILDNIQKWVREERSGFLIAALLNPDSTFSEISAAVEHYSLIASQGIELNAFRDEWFRSTLVRLTLNDQIKYIDVAKHYFTINDFADVLRRVIHTTNSHGKLGGKSAGMLLAEKILTNAASENEIFKNIKTPKTWFLTSDCVLYHMTNNNMEDIVEQKYKPFVQVRQEYPYVVQLFKSGRLPPEIIKGLSMALDDFGDVPLIVRSSSLLEDQAGTAFAGKYKSLFIANKGSKKKRLVALMDAITEVFASLFGPDPIEYRIEHGLIDQHEEMGIMIQQVVGKQFGDYYLPAFAGVAFSNNEFRWSSRIKRDDGLVRIVPGLGTRAVDRLSDDYPVLATPGQPGLRVNVTTEEIIHYSPKKMDVINLKTRKFETIDAHTFFKQQGNDIPMANQLVSILEQDYIQIPIISRLSLDKNPFVITFEGLFTRTPFLKQMKAILSTLQKAFGHPVDIEFAHDGTNFYILQCRAQAYGEISTSAPIPRGLPPEKVLFTANKYISNCKVPDIKFIVYVDPQKYSELTKLEDMVNVGRVVGRLNQILPKRQFILMGPGRWGSRGDIKLGVNVTYSDINNTAMLIEIARRKKDYLPELSFGTHFFQDLVEASIGYLPLYPDESKLLFNDDFLLKNKNYLHSLLPDAESLSDVVHVIDVPSSANGQILKVLTNADSDEAIAYLTESGKQTDFEDHPKSTDLKPPKLDPDSHWLWRQQAVETIASRLDPQRFGVKDFYIFGSTKNATAGPQSDIDVLIHFNGTPEQRKALLTWLEGWSLCLSQVNFLRTGFKSDGLLEVHIVTDEDIENNTSFASKIGAANDAARQLVMGTALPNRKKAAGN